MRKSIFFVPLMLCTFATLRAQTALTTSVVLVANTPLGDHRTAYTFEVYVTDAQIQTHDLALTLGYADAAIAPNTAIAVNYEGENWFGAAATTVSDDKINSVLTVHLSRLLAGNVPADGKVLRVTTIIEDNIGGRGKRFAPMAAAISSAQVAVYPTLLSEGESVYFSVADNDAPTAYTLLDTSGKTVISAPIYANDHRILLPTALPKGVYLLWLTTAHSQTATKLVVQ